MSLVDWISSNPDTAVAIGGAALTYLWNRARGKKADDTWDTVLKLGHQAIAGLLRDPNLFDDNYVRSKLNSAIWVGLSRLGIKRSKHIEQLVDEAVEHVKGELAEQIWKQSLAGYVKVSEQTSATLKGHLNPTGTL